MTTTVRDVMSTDLVTVEPSTMMTEAAAAMSSARVGSVLVLEEGALVGIFTERDLLSAFEQFRADPARVSPVSKGTTRNPLTIGPDATVGEAMDKMLDGGFRHLPVMDGRTLVGIVSMRDLARSISKGRTPVGDPRSEGARGRLDTRAGRSNRSADPRCRLPPAAA